MLDTDFDDQKLMFHPREVARWLAQGDTRGPLYTEMELTGICNQKCVFCGVEHLVNRSAVSMEGSLARRVVDGLAGAGNRSVMFSGHGEPLLHEEAAAIIRHASDRMSVSVTTNGTRLDADKVELIDGLRWIRFSVNGCDPEGYTEIHGASPDAFHRVMENIEGAVRRKRDHGLEVTIGTQLVLLDENAAGVVAFAGRLKALGVDYFSVKPYSEHPGSLRPLQVDYSEYRGLEAPLKALEDGDFKVSFRWGSMSLSGRPKSYGTCYGTRFLGYVSANGDLWACNIYCGDGRFLIGNLRDDDFEALWNGPRHREVLDFVEKDLDLSGCRDVCRMEACNRYLWRLKNPLSHDDFI